MRNAAEMAAPAGENVNKMMFVLKDKENVWPKIPVTNMNLLVIAKVVASAIDHVMMKNVLSGVENAALKIQAQ